MAPTFGVRELSWVSFKSVNFSAILNMCYRDNCHEASCLQANDAEGRKNDRLKKEKERNLANQGVTAIYIREG